MISRIRTSFRGSQCPHINFSTANRQPTTISPVHSSWPALATAVDLAMACKSQSQLLLLAFVSCLSLASAATSFRPQPRPDDSDLAQTATTTGGMGARSCWYTVQIKTSCASPAHTSDTISLAFGAVYKDEVYAAQLGGAAGAFDPCATDTFKIRGPCGYGVCYLYLRRAGRSGWTPEWVRVYEPTSADTPSTFRYGDPLPNNVWYGFDRCPHRVASSSASSAAAVQTL